jgi:hypothetical protein
VRFAIESFIENRAEATVEETEYHSQFQTVEAPVEEEEQPLSDELGEEYRPQAPVSLTSGLGKKRLWSSKECRERWQSALQSPRSVAAVALSVAALRHHCFALGLYTDPKSRLKREDVYFQAASWVHAGAFGQQQKGKKKKKKKR